MWRRLSQSVGVCLLWALTANAQVPGDGILDIYYFPADGLSVKTTAGPITRPAGTVTVDTDGNDVVAFAFEGPEDIQCVSGLHLCADGLLPLLDGSPSEWATGFNGGIWQFVLTSPLNPPGFNGVIGEYDDPSDIYPNDGLGAFAAGLGSGSFGDNVTIVPEPSALSLVWICVAALASRLCRPNRAEQ